MTDYVTFFDHLGSDLPKCVDFTRILTATQIEAGQWTGDPARSGTAPTAASFAPISTVLNNQLIILHSGGSVSFFSIKMGPFTHAGIPNLYATQAHRGSVSAAELPPLPALAPGDTMFWGDQQLRIDAGAGALVSAGSGAVDLSVVAYDSGFNLIALPPNTDDTLTLTIDTTPVTTAHINSLRAFRADGTEVSTATGLDCPAYEIGPNGYIVLNITVTDANGHLWEYEVVPDYGHGSSGTTTPGLRGYGQPVPGTFPGGGYQAPDRPQKSFVGGTEDITYHPPTDCCYDFHLYVGKRVTDGTYYPSLYTADFQTVSLRVSA